MYRMTSLEVETLRNHENPNKNQDMRPSLDDIRFDLDDKFRLDCKEHTTRSI